MTERIIDFSEEPASLHIEYNQLIIETETMTTKVPVNEIACLIAGHPYVKYTNAVLSHLSSAGGLFIVCNKNRLPEGMLLPLDNNYIQAERFSAQASITKPQKKQIWKQIIKAKIDSQAQVLYFHYGDDNGLRNLKSKVLSGDKKNTEAYAARRYWHLLFGDNFRRETNADTGINALLNYGYGILRALTARAVCGAGLHPSLGLHHHNRYNSFCLVDDIMEPYRPIIDSIVYDFKIRGMVLEVNKESKQFLIPDILNKYCMFSDERRKLTDAVRLTVLSLVDIIMKRKRKIIYPKIY